MSPVSADTDSGVTNSAPALVRMARVLHPALGQPADQLQGLVGGDAAADDQKNAFAAHGCEILNAPKNTSVGAGNIANHVKKV